MRRPEAVVAATPPKTPHHLPNPPPSSRRIGVKIHDDDDYSPTVKVRMFQFGGTRDLLRSDWDMFNFKQGWGRYF